MALPSAHTCPPPVNLLFETSYIHASEPIRTTVVDTPYRGGVLCLMWWIRHTEAGYYANVVGYYACCGGYAIQRQGIMLTWWGIMLDVVDTPYRGGA